MWRLSGEQPLFLGVSLSADRAVSPWVAEERERGWEGIRCSSKSRNTCLKVLFGHFESPEVVMISGKHKKHSSQLLSVFCAGLPGT